MSDTITLPREVAEKALSMLDLLGLLGENVAGRVRAALAESTVKDSLTVEETLRRENDRLREAWKFLRAEIERLREDNEWLRGLLTEAAAIDYDCGCIGCHEKRYELKDRIDAALRQEDTK